MTRDLTVGLSQTEGKLVMINRVHFQFKRAWLAAALVLCTLGSASALAATPTQLTFGTAEEAATAAPLLEVTGVTVLPAEEEPADTLDGEPGSDGTASDWLPGIRDEHEDEGGWQARWLDRPTWDRTVTPNIRKRTGQRPVRTGRRRG